MDTQSNEKREPAVTKSIPVKPKRSKIFPIILLILIVGGAWFGISKYIHSRHHEETDDAQVESNISPVISRIGGYMSRINVDDNQFVHKGDTLMILDKRDLELTLAQAEAALSTARSNYSAAEANSL